MFAWAIEAMFSRLCVATIPVEEIFATHTKSIGTTTNASWALHSIDWTGSSLFKVWTITMFSIECSTRIGTNSTARSDTRRLSNEWLSYTGELLHNRFYQQNSGEGCTKYRFSATICWIFYAVFDAYGKEWRYNIGTTFNGFWSTIHHATSAQWLSNSHKKKVKIKNLRSI